MSKSTKSPKGAGKSSSNGTAVSFNFYRGSKMEAWKLEKGEKFEASNFTDRGIIKTILKKEKKATGKQDALLHLDMVYAPDTPLYEEAKAGSKRISATALLNWLNESGTHLAIGRHKFYGYPQLILESAKPVKNDFDVNSDEDVEYE